MASWQAGMKVDPVALASCGVYSETYGMAQRINTANLFASLGYVEDAPLYAGTIPLSIRALYKIRQIVRGSFGKHRRR